MMWEDIILPCKTEGDRGLHTHETPTRTAMVIDLIHRLAGSASLFISRHRTLTVHDMDVYHDLAVGAVLSW